MTLPDNWPAFPVSTANEQTGHQDGMNSWQFPGMTLRDYFAAKAMQGLTSAAFNFMSEHQEIGPATAAAQEMMKDIGATAYMMADAMLAGREVTR